MSHPFPEHFISSEVRKERVFLFALLRLASIELMVPRYDDKKKEDSSAERESAKEMNEGGR
jgi:hypothetical protein